MGYATFLKVALIQICGERQQLYISIQVLLLRFVLPRIVWLSMVLLYTLVLSLISRPKLYLLHFKKSSKGYVRGSLAFLNRVYISL